jgi:hypothetical protein
VISNKSTCKNILNIQKMALVHFVNIICNDPNMVTQKLKEKKVITPTSTCTYISRIESFIGIYCTVKFVGSIDVPHDTHVFGAKHFFFVRLKWIHQL